MKHLQYFAEKSFDDFYTYECSGSPKPVFPYKADFTEFMTKHGFKKTTLTKKTDMLIVQYKGQGTLKEQKAERYGIPVYTYAEAKKRVKEMADEMKKFNM